MKATEILLRKVTELYPPNEGQRHNLTLLGDGLQLTLMLVDGYHPVFLPERSLGKSPNDLIDEISKLLSQEGVLC